MHYIKTIPELITCKTYTCTSSIEIECCIHGHYKFEKLIGLTKIPMQVLIMLRLRQLQATATLSQTYGTMSTLMQLMVLSLCLLSAAFTATLLHRDEKHSIQGNLFTSESVMLRTYTVDGNCCFSKATGQSSRNIYNFNFRYM